MSELIVINVISPEGNTASFNITPDMTINKIKNIVIKHFYGDDESKKLIKFRLIHTFKFKWLIDDYSVTDEEINKNDELMLINIRPTSIKENLSEDTLKGPSEEVILQATNDLHISNAPQRIPFLHCPADFQNEIRTILITLVRASAKIIMYSPEALKFYKILKEKLEHRYKPKWLIEHQNDPEDEDDLDLAIFEKECQSLEKEGNLINIIDLLLESFHHYKKMDFKPSSKTVQSLLKMGFEEKAIIDALKVTGNNQDNACEWLLGERRYSLQDLDKELDSDNPIYEAIMNDPRIQLTLTDPNMLLVYLSLLETPVSIAERRWDPDVKPVLDHIITTYYAEKHIRLNQRIMVYYFTSEVVQPPVTLFMGVDKYENEDLIKWGWPEDVWFHVDKYSSAHVYLRLCPGQTIDDIPSAVLEDAAQLVKANSIEGNKMNDVDVVYTMWSNLKKTQSMEEGQVGFHKDKDVRKIRVAKRINTIVNRLTKTKRAEQVNLRAEREERDRNERKDKKKLLREQKEKEKAEEKRRKEEAEMRSYNSLFNTSNMISNTENSGYDSDDFM
ncbi:PREDICTED: ubiquitin-associated domain-containing protein 1-like [Habropoda laboriosa]|uniref:ubiquitin-associated domain-containing protein 1-like n=1 Tax=Habropoda laboriosa TaxID=597456 RepID=UPI00083D3314|nr:PREDICTED: ubiquitin-associated domain-containing protein 1-like [Habropoda laboriosa]